MSPEPSSQSKICPTCGTKLNENATRCMVCGRSFTPPAGKTAAKEVKAARLPQLTLSLPIAIGIFLLLLALGASIVYILLQTSGQVVAPTVTPTVTYTHTITMTPTLEPTATTAPTQTPLAPFDHIVAAGEVCSTIALRYGVSVASIAALNNLAPDCGVLFEGQKLLIPQPTPTPSPMPTATLSAGQATEQACGKVDYTVQANDTLSSIAANYNVTVDTIKAYNSLSTDIVYEGMYLMIPLCERKPTAGPTPTPTLPPPYTAPNLLLPADGTLFANVTDVITLQWAAVGTLRDNEAYAVTVEDVTAGGDRRIMEYVKDTKFIVPDGLRPTDNLQHIYRWYVMPVRQTGSTNDGSPIYEPAGAISTPRVFGWLGISAAATP
jgi:LysM repeat protein